MAAKKATSTKKSVSTTSKKTTTKVVAATPVKKSTPKPARITAKTEALFQGRSPLLGAFIGEFIGTFVLAMIVLIARGDALIIGFGVVAITLIIGTLSGAHINPLVTIGAWVTRKVSGKRALGYVAAQVLGAMLAFVVLSHFSSVAPKQDTNGNNGLAMFSQQAQVPQVFSLPALKGDTQNVGYILGAELLAATIFGFIVSSAMRERRDRTAHALTIGFGLFTALAIGSGALLLTGVSSQLGAQLVAVANPALAIPLQAVTWPINDLWPLLVYVLAPIVGGAIGFFLYDVLRGESDGGDDNMIHDEF